MMFQSLLKKCGRFLSKLVVNRAEGDNVDNEILHTIRRECPNIQEIDIGLHEIRGKNDIETIKPIFSKLKKFYLSIDKRDIFDEDLIELFKLNKNIEVLDLFLNKRLTIDILYALPCETIRELLLSRLQTCPLHIICNVSRDLYYFLF